MIPIARTPLRPALVTAILFLIVAIPLCGVLPLWLDEILQLIETRETSVSEMIVHLPRNSGAAPLGYLVQQATFKVAGYSVFWARFPSVIFASLSVFCVVLLGVELGLKRSWVGATFFAVFPLTLRYAAESRVYSQALFFSILATLFYLRVARRPTWAKAGAYWLALTAAAYTQPYSACVGLAHILWSVAYGERKAALLGGTAFVLTIAAFLPWYLWSKPIWVDGITEGALHFSASAKTPLMLYRELAGAGYWGSGVLFILCFVAIKRGYFTSRIHALLLLLIVVPLVGVFCADAWFDYFLAARQFIWVLPAIAILAATAVERYSRAGVMLAAVLVLICIRQNIRYFTANHEDWEAAASVIAEQVKSGACLLVVAPEHALLYRFFQPELRSGCCNAPKIVLAITPYTTKAQRQTAVTALIESGYKLEGQAVVGRSVIDSFACARRKYGSSPEGWPVKSFNYMTEMGSVGSFKNVTESASGVAPVLVYAVSVGVAPERRSKADATDWLRSDRQPSWGFLRGLFRFDHFGEVLSRGLGLKRE
jgi:hypothetical protein